MSANAGEATPCPICGSVHALGSSSCPLRRSGEPGKASGSPAVERHWSPEDTDDADARTSRKERLQLDGAELTSPIAFEAAPDSTLKPGTMIGEFVIDGYIGAGGMGVVYRATHPLIGKKAVVKIIKGKMGSDAEHVQRFIREARAVNQISHPNIVDVFSFGTLPDKRPYLIMEWLQGENLAKRLERGRIPMRESLEILQQVISALDAAHTYGVIHRDLKPDNIYLVALPNDDRPLVKLLDFGLAKITEARNDLFLGETANGVILGTPSYLSPEAVRGGNVDHRSDIYTLGVLAFEMLTGGRPFVGSTVFDTIFLHVTAPPPSARAREPAVPAAIDSLLVEMMAKNPAQRPSLSRVRTVLGAQPMPDAPRPEPSHEEETTGARTGDFLPIARELASHRAPAWAGVGDHTALPELEARASEPPPEESTRTDTDLLAARAPAVRQPSVRTSTSSPPLASGSSSGTLSGVGIVVPAQAASPAVELFSPGDPHEHDPTQFEHFPSFAMATAVPAVRRLGSTPSLELDPHSVDPPRPAAEPPPATSSTLPSLPSLPRLPLRRARLRLALALLDRARAWTEQAASSVAQFIRTSPGNPQRLALVAGALLLVMLLGVAASIHHSSQADPPVQLWVRGLPSDATLRWGDTVLTSNPSLVPRSHSSVPLTISRPGYDPVKIDLVPNANLDFTVEMIASQKPNMH